MYIYNVYAEIDGHTYQHIRHRPGVVANPARHGQLNRGNDFPVSSFAPENLVSRDRFGNFPSRISPLVEKNVNFVIKVCNLLFHLGRTING